MNPKSILFLFLGVLFSLVPIFIFLSWVYITIQYSQEPVENQVIMYKENTWLGIPNRHPFLFNFLPIMFGIIAMSFLSMSVKPFLKAKSNNFLDLYLNAILSFPLFSRSKKLHDNNPFVILVSTITLISSASTIMCIWWLM